MPDHYTYVHVQLFAATKLRSLLDVISRLIQMSYSCLLCMYIASSRGNLVGTSYHSTPLTQHVCTAHSCTHLTYLVYNRRLRSQLLLTTILLKVEQQIKGMCSE